VWRVIVEDDDLVHAGERTEHCRSIVGRVHRAPRTLQSPDGIIAVHQDDESIAEQSGLFQHLHVAGVKDVEAPTCGDDHVGALSGTGGREDAVEPWQCVSPPGAIIETDTTGAAFADERGRDPNRLSDRFGEHGTTREGRCGG
jgi:hypothetical protein